MGFDFTKDYRLFMSENGPRVLIDSPYTIGEEKLKLSPVELILPFGMSRTDTIRYLKNLNFQVKTTVDHSLVFSPIHEKMLEDNLIDLEDIKIAQLVVNGDEIYIDEFGLEVYSYSTLSDESKLIDKRYD
jgi:hypothetical protein